MSETIIRQHRVMRCEKCGHTWKLEHRANGFEDAQGVLRLSMLTACPNCETIARHPVAGEVGWNPKRKPTDKAERIQSTMRYDPENHQFLNDLSQETGLSLADLVNEMVALFRNDEQLRQEVIERLAEAESE